METMEAIRKRKSLKNCLSGREIEREKLEQVLDAARLAPSARNKQPWRFVVVQGKENVERVANKVFVGFAEGNLVVKEANVLIFAFANHQENLMPDGAGDPPHVRRGPVRAQGGAGGPRGGEVRHRYPPGLSGRGRL
jgi:nitroreductase